MLQRIINMSCYAVRSGRIPGIYEDWAACKAQVSGFSGASYKKFKSRAEAQSFINEEANSTKPVEGEGAAIASSSDGDIPETNDVYTDGACTHNGQPNAKAAIGVFWGEASSWNVSERLPGRQTNNRAEIHAARKAIEQAKSMEKTNIRLHTDSQFLIDSMTKWVQNWQANGWKQSSGQPVINKEDFVQLMASAESMNITWEKVAAHQGVPGNEWADKLAVAGLEEDLPAEYP